MRGAIPACPLPRWCLPSRRCLRCALIAPAVREQRPDCARVLVRHGDDGACYAAPFDERVDPLALGVGLAHRSADDGTAAVHEQGSKVLVAALTNVPQRHAIPACAVTRHEPEPERRRAAMARTPRCGQVIAVPGVGESQKYLDLRPSFTRTCDECIHHPVDFRNPSARDYPGHLS